MKYFAKQDSDERKKSVSLRRNSSYKNLNLVLSFYEIKKSIMKRYKLDLFDEAAVNTLYLTWQLQYGLVVSQLQYKVGQTFLSDHH